MRIVIDLQVCQCGPEQARADALRLAQELARGAGQHQVWIALNGQFGATVGALRQAFDGLLPAGRVRLFELPLAEPGAPDAPWLRQAGEQIRAAFLASLNPDLVLVPGFGAAAALAQSGGAAAAGYATVLCPDPQFDPAAGHPRQLAALRGADLLLVGGEAARTALAAAGAAAELIDFDADRLWPRLAALLEARAAAQPAPPARARLAYVSPLPPQRSGIADYSAELVPQLARYYDVELIVDQPQVDPESVPAGTALRNLDWFARHAASFDRIIYHFGNSPMHQHMFGLLERHPGVVVLHDFYLGNLLHHMQHSGYRAQAMSAALFASHGLSGLLDSERIGARETAWKYPCNKDVLDQASGVIVHADYPRQLAAAWYGADAARHWHTLPLLRGLPGGDRLEARRAARAELGLADDALLVCSFGLLGPTKLNDEILRAWQASALAADARCQLVFVGQIGDAAYGRALQAEIAAQPGARVSITGFVEPARYQSYLAACDVAVQLRANSRGETSAAVLDCLLHGVATIVNAHGAAAELPAAVLRKLDEQLDTAQLAAALSELGTAPAARAALGRQAAAYMAAEHAPEAVGLAYRDAIEDIERHSARRHYARLLGALRGLGPAPGPQPLERCARAIAANQAPRAPRQLLVDISALVQKDLRTGIQRVVRSILMALLDEPPAGYRVEPVYSPGNGLPYRYARQWAQASLKQPHGLDDAPADMRAGDLFLGLDLMMHGTHQNRALLDAFRARGGRLYFVVYDILPLLRPAAFPFGASASFAEWLGTVAEVADGLACISRAVADEVAAALAAQAPARATPLQLGYFHLGADIDASAPSSGMPADAGPILEQLAVRPSLIMVGTLEPRKGQAQALAAFELLWAAGVEANLVIVGKRGWMVDELAARLAAHPQRGRRLFWLEGVSDQMLLELYRGAAGLLAASEGEGFGLPLIEAAQHGLPIVARDLPVFREVAGEHAFYFDGGTPEALAAALRHWLELLGEGRVPASAAMPWLTWRDSAKQLLALLAEPSWYRQVAPSPPLKSEH